MRKKITKQKFSIYGINGCYNVINQTKLEISRIDIMVDSVAFKKGWIRNIIKSKKYPIHQIPKVQFLKKYKGKRTQGIVISFSGNLVKELNYKNLQKDDECLLVIDNIEDPQNLGQIIRTAECANISGLLLPEHQSVQLTDAVLQVSQGAFTHLPIYKCGNLHQFLRSLKKEGFWIIGVENSIKSKNWYELNYQRKLVLVLGSEGKGIRPIIFKTCDELITIPMKGKINSLNVSSATSAILFERQRQISK